MWYVLNFKNHKFHSATYAEEAAKIAKEEIEDYLLEEDDIEIVDASDVYARYDYATFVATWISPDEN